MNFDTTRHINVDALSAFGGVYVAQERAKSSRDSFAKYERELAKLPHASEG